LPILRGSASLSPTASAAHATTYYGGSQECDNVYAAGSAWTDIQKLGQFATNMMPHVAGHEYYLQYDLLASGLSPANLANGANGDYDTYADTAVSNIVTAGIASDTVVVIGREFNGNWYRWAAQGHEADYTAYFNRVAAKFKAAGIRVALCVSMGITNNFDATNLCKTLHADYFGVDFYAGKYQDSAATAAQRWSDILTRTMGLNWVVSTATAMGIPIVVCEWGLNIATAGMVGGSGGGGDDPLFVQNSHDWMVNNNVHAFMPLAGDGDAANPHDWSHFPNAAATFKSLFTAPVIAVPEVTNLNAKVTTLTSQLATANAQIAAGGGGQTLLQMLQAAEAQAAAAAATAKANQVAAAAQASTYAAQQTAAAAQDAAFLQAIKAAGG
jgi:hypothetical protein